MEYITPSECATKWQSLVKRYQQPLPFVPDDATTPGGNDKNQQVEDPFDCTDLIIPPTAQLVDDVLAEKCREWHDLDSRILVPEDNDDEDDKDGNGAQGSACVGRGRGSRNRKRKSPAAAATAAASVRSGQDSDHDSRRDNGKDSKHRHSDQEEDSIPNGNDENPNDNDNEKDGHTNTNDQNDNNDKRGGDYAGLNWGWHANRIRLPDHFDYACQRPPPRPPPHNKNTRRRKVVNLLDPGGEPLDYEVELDAIFRSTPTLNVIIERLVLADGGGDDTAASSSSSFSLASSSLYVPHSLKIRQEIEDGLKEYTRMDGHALGRMRKRDRHHLPRILYPSNPSKNSDGDNNINKHNNNNNNNNGHDNDEKSQPPQPPPPYDIDGVVIRIECWRSQPKRGSSTDSNRLEMEFAGSQTLLDVHNAIVECANDDLFRDGMALATNFNEYPHMNANTNDGSNDNSHFNANSNTPNSTNSTVNTANVNGGVYSGVFFIEGIFYVTGDVDYATPIREWLERIDDDRDKATIHPNNSNVANRSNSLEHPQHTYINPHPDSHTTPHIHNNNNNDNTPNIPHTKKRKPRKRKPKPNRRTPLGIHPNAPLSIQRMSETKLESLSVRLAVRYAHIFHGDCESAFFISDVRAHLSNERFGLGTSTTRTVSALNLPSSSSSQTSRVNHHPNGFYPLLHDIWTSSCTHQLCQGCDHCPAMLATMEDEMTDGGMTFLCFGCFRNLHYDCDWDCDTPLHNPTTHTNDNDNDNDNGENVEKDASMTLTNSNAKDGHRHAGRLRYNNFRVFPLRVLQDQQDLSVGHDANDALF